MSIYVTMILKTKTNLINLLSIKKSLSPLKKDQEKTNIAICWYNTI